MFECLDAQMLFFLAGGLLWKQFFHILKMVFTYEKIISPYLYIYMYIQLFFFINIYIYIWKNCFCYTLQKREQLLIYANVCIYINSILFYIWMKTEFYIKTGFLFMYIYIYKQTFVFLQAISNSGGLLWKQFFPHTKIYIYMYVRNQKNLNIQIVHVYIYMYKSWPFLYIWK